jgi:hypothetical protein
MDTLDMATTRNTGSRSANQAYQQAAWRAPGDARFDSRPANDWSVSVEPAAVEEDEAGGVPGWLVVLAGAIVVSLLAVFAANAMAL